MALYQHSGPSHDTSTPVGITEFEILKASHKFLRDDDEKASSWDEQLAAKYYTSLYREFAVCDLKHYKSGSFALRWRTEEEVLAGSGETTCGNTRCQRHFAPRFPGHDSKLSLELTTLELPFSYIEQGENKSALVKVALCEKCVKKLMWKRQKQKEKETEKEKATAGLDLRTVTGDREVTGAGDVDDEDPLAKRRKKRSKDENFATRRRRSSRSLSPRRPHTFDIPSRTPSTTRKFGS